MYNLIAWRRSDDRWAFMNCKSIAKLLPLIADAFVSSSKPCRVPLGTAIGLIKRVACQAPSREM